MKNILSQNPLPKSKYVLRSLYQFQVSIQYLPTINLFLCGMCSRACVETRDWQQMSFSTAFQVIFWYRALTEAELSVLLVWESSESRGPSCFCHPAWDYKYLLLHSGFSIGSRGFNSGLRASKVSIWLCYLSSSHNHLKKSKTFLSYVYRWLDLRKVFSFQQVLDYHGSITVSQK